MKTIRKEKVVNKKKEVSKYKHGKEQPGDEMIDIMLEKYGGTREAIFGKEGWVAMLTKRAVEKALAGELTYHLGYKERAKPEEQTNYRNGYSKKMLQGEKQVYEIEIPRDREGSFEPIMVPKREKRFREFDERIINLYARGMTVREIKGFLEEEYGAEVSPDFISTVTDSINEDVKEWQQRPLDTKYAIVFFDAVRVKMRDDGVVKNKAVHLALGINVDGQRDVLGMWIEQNEGAKHWLKVMNDLRNRGVEDIMIAVVDGLKGFPEAITTVFPETIVQTCIVHLTRFSLSSCGWKERKEVASELKKIYQSDTAEAAEEQLTKFEKGPWGKKFSMIGQSWRRHWEEVIPFFSFSREVRKMIYTTNAIESVNMQLRKVIKNRGHFPNDEAAAKLLYLALRNISKKWKNPPTGWSAAAGQFAIQFGERFKKY
jgi:putative transposase